MKVNVGAIFHKKPMQWGLRGDPYLWEDLEKYFSSIAIPYPEDDFVEEICKVFHQLTGHKMESKGTVRVSGYSHGGMSSGMICQEFWMNEAIPLLVERLHELNQKIGNNYD